MPFRLPVAAFLALCILPSARAADPPAPSLTVREVTVFKDGYAFVSETGNLPVDADGTATLEKLPAPILGTFWSQATDKGVTLRAVIAGQTTVTATRDAATIPELLRANVGKTVRIRDRESAPIYEATIVGVRGETGAVLPADYNGLGRGDNLVLLRTLEGIRAVQIASILELTLPGEPVLTQPVTSLKNRLTFTLDGARAGSTTGITVTYLQDGLRWVPGYKIVTDGNGSARVSLQATLVNDLTDMDDVTVHLVVGNPMWDFKTVRDPIALQETLAQIETRNFGRRGGESSFANVAAVQTQLPDGVDRIISYDANNTSLTSGTTAPTPGVTGSEGREDLFYFTVTNVRLKRGERMVLPVAEFTLPYTDVYTLDLPPVPPSDWRNAYQNGSNAPDARIAALLTAPRVRHIIRLCNTSKYPLTTAPALLFSGDRVLGQSTMTYTAPAGETDLPIGTASNITLKREDKEMERVEKARQINGYDYTQVSLHGAITLTNYGTKPARLEVKRYVLGAMLTASDGGTADTLDVFTNPAAIPEWWNTYNWPGEVGRVNGLGRAAWTTTIPNGKAATLTYTYQYLWR